MSQSICTGICRGGPWDGNYHAQTTVPERGGRFNLIGLAGVRGSYTWAIETDDGEDGGPGWVWRWGPWIEEPEKTEP